jgi:hypothetical protein
MNLLKKIVIGLLVLLATKNIQAQGNQNIMQLTGLIVGGDSLYGIPGVHVYVPKAGRGTSTNYYGYFSLPTQVGDSIVISAIGYAKKEFVITYNEKKSISLIIELKEDTTVLPLLEIFPYPTEELFKHAFLALKMPDNLYNGININDQIMSRVTHANKTDAKSYYLYKAANRQSFVLLDAFAWSRAIKDLKNKRAVRRRKASGLDDE